MKALGAKALQVGHLEGREGEGRGGLLKSNSKYTHIYKSGCACL